jgi:diguanylate cyclase (GGDEF)-like protein/PAS domain S-box-containing protein
MYRPYSILLLLFATLIMLVLGSIYQREKVLTEQHLRLESNLLMERQIDVLSSGLEEIRSDVRHLAAQQQLRRIYRTDNPEQATKALEQEYLVFSAIKKRYDQVRFIDKQGMEIVRVNFNAGSPAIVPRGQLQSKSHRYYFSETMGLEEGETYTSPMDLNIEHKEVELPLKPMIRVATPVFDEAGERIGIVVLNYLAQRMLSAFSQNSSAFPGHAMLINPDGYFLVGIRKELEWAFMFDGKADAAIEGQFPDLWQTLRHQASGHHRDRQGLFTFTNMGKMNQAGGDKNHVHCLACDWTVVVLVPQDRINAAAYAQVQNAWPVALMIICVMAVGLWLILAYRQRHREGNKQLAQLHRAISNERDLFVGGPSVVFKRRNEYSWPVEWVSANIHTILGYDPEQFLAGELTYASIIAPEYLGQVADGINQLKEEEAISFEHEPYQLVRADGAKVWVQESASVIRNKAGRITHIYGYVNDITDLVEAEKQIQRSHVFNQTVLDTIADPTLVIDTNNYSLVLANKAAKSVYLNPNERTATPLTCHQLSHKRDTPCEGESDPCPISLVKSDHTKARVIHKHISADGTPMYVEVIATPIFNEQGELTRIIESHRDITERIETETQLRELAATDGLTKVYNRTKFDEELQIRFDLSRASHQLLGLIMLDIDHFKQINDTHGHDVGDLALKELVQVLRNHIRKKDLLARWGGEEFMLLTSGISLADLETMAEHLRASVEKHTFPMVGRVTASFGVTLLAHQDSIESLLKRVDSALYQSKLKGRNRVTLAEG